MSILRGLDAQMAAESTPIFDRLMADCGTLLDEAPWQPELLAFDDQAWRELPADYELPPMPLFMLLPRMKRIVSAQYDTQMMETVS